MPMKNILRSVVGGIAAVVLAVVAQAANLAPAAFSAGTVKGDVTYKLAGTSQYLALTPGTALPQGATVKTGPGSLAVIVFASGSTASIRPNSEVEITKFEQEAFSGPLPANAEPSVSNTQIKVVDGQVISKVAKLKQGSEYVVTTPVGAAGVRGTTFLVSYDAATGSFTVSTTEGLVFVTVNAGTGAATEVAVGQTVTYGDGQTGTVRALTPAELAAIEQAVAEAGSSALEGVQPVSVAIPIVDTSIVSPN